MVSQTVYLKSMVFFHPYITDHEMYHRISVLVPVLVEYLSTCPWVRVRVRVLLLCNSRVRVPEIQYSSTVSTSTEYEYPSPDQSMTKRWCQSIDDQVSYPTDSPTSTRPKNMFCRNSVIFKTLHDEWRLEKFRLLWKISDHWLTQTCPENMAPSNYHQLTQCCL